MRKKKVTFSLHVSAVEPLKLCRLASPRPLNLNIWNTTTPIEFGSNQEKTNPKLPALVLILDRSQGQ